MSLHAVASLALGLRRVEQRDPIETMRWLPLQQRYREEQARYRLLRAGNQSVGKTTVCLADLAEHAMGTHPYRSCPEHGEYWVICAAWSQSVSIQNKLAALLPPSRLHPDTEHTEERGFRGKHPSVSVRHNDGGYSIIRFKTTRQGTLDLAGATIRGALFDEVPSSQGVYSEVLKRVQATGGWLSVGMTPVGAPVEWIRELVDEGILVDIHAPLTPDQLIPIGGRQPRMLPDGTRMDADWIAQIIAETPGHEVPVRVHGEWEMRVEGRYFDVFVSDASTPGAHVTTEMPVGEVELHLGIDHGDRPGKQVAVLVAVQQHEGHVAVSVIDEYTDPTGHALPEDDAQALREMLARHGLRWHQLDGARGDRVHLRGQARQKSNRDLAVYLARQLRIPRGDLRPRISTVKRGEGRGKGSVGVGARWLYHAMVRPGAFRVHPRCTRLIEALDTWSGPGPDSPAKDPVDALRYALDPWIFSRHRPGPPPTVRIGH